MGMERERGNKKFTKTEKTTDRDNHRGMERERGNQATAAASSGNATIGD